MTPFDMNNLTDDVTQLLIAAVVVLGPVWLIAQILKYRAGRRIHPAEVALVQQIARIADRMDQRLGTVERILDTETPAWRNPTGATYDRQTR